MTPRSLLLMLALFAMPAFGQVELGFRVYPLKSLQYESVAIQFAIRNNGSEAIRMGADGNARAFFDLRTQDRHLVTRIAADVLEPVEVMPAETATLTNRHIRGGFTAEPGVYLVEARVEYAGKAYISEPARIDVVSAAEIARLDAGTLHGPRIFSVRVLDRDQHRHLFLRVDDPASNVCYTVIDMGRTVSGSPPAMKMDADGRVHLLQQASPTRYRHWVVDAFGSVEDYENVESPHGQARLVEDDGGSYRVETPPPSLKDASKPEPFESGGGSFR